MIPLRNNLLSPEKKEHLIHMVRIQFLKNIFEVLLVVSSIVGIILLGSERILQNYFTSLTESMISVQNRHSQEVQEIRHINKTLQQVENIQKQYYVWTPLLLSLSEATNSGIVLNNLSVDQKNKHISLEGHATNRETFLIYQKKIKQLENIKDAQSPLSDLTKIENFSFTLSIDLK